MNQVKTLMAIALSLPVLFLSGCKSVPPYSSDYAKARASIQGIPLDDAKALEIGLRFTSAFNTLGTPKFVENAGALYADQLFINDTLSQFSSRKKLLEHFQGMNQRVSNVNVKLLNTSYYQDSAYVHWHMVYDFKKCSARHEQWIHLGSVKSKSTQTIRLFSNKTSGIPPMVCIVLCLM